MPDACWDCGRTDGGQTPCCSGCIEGKRMPSFHDRVRDELLASLNRRERVVWHLTVKWLVFRYGCRWWKPWARGDANGCK